MVKTLGNLRLLFAVVVIRILARTTSQPGILQFCVIVKYSREYDVVENAAEAGSAIDGI
jgi:hypothetical protein